MYREIGYPGRARVKHGGGGGVPGRRRGCGYATIAPCALPAAWCVGPVRDGAGHLGTAGAAEGPAPGIRRPLGPRIGRGWCSASRAPRNRSRSPRSPRRCSPPGRDGCGTAAGGNRAMPEFGDISTAVLERRPGAAARNTAPARPLNAGLTQVQQRPDILMPGNPETIRAAQRGTAWACGAAGQRRPAPRARWRCAAVTGWARSDPGGDRRPAAGLPHANAVVPRYGWSTRPWVTGQPQARRVRVAGGRADRVRPPGAGRTVWDDDR